MLGELATTGLHQLRCRVYATLTEYIIDLHTSFVMLAVVSA